MKITLTNVRGFEGTHHFNIRPITILIGENSSGKTTLLAAIHAALNPEFPTTENPFNRVPFDLGSFDTIATYRGGKYGRATSFSVGWEKDDGSASIVANFNSQGGAPRLADFALKNGVNQLTGKTAGSNFDFEFTFGGSTRRASLESTAAKHRTIKFSSAASKGAKTLRLQDVFRYYLDSSNPKSKKESMRDREYDVVDSLHELTVGNARSRPHATALAPLRTRPRRTYDELNEEFKPEGDHIPIVLARLLASKQKEGSTELEALMKYGRESGLFEKIDVKRLGKQPSDPFQVRVKMKGPDANLVDVGYGVSQSLPIVIDSIMAPGSEVLLVQQPEVHLHPKAQAALGTFFVDLATSTKKQFVIETHSDYLVDRLRIEISKGNISARNVQLLYLERKGLDVKVHELTLDEIGNITNAPPSYRSFFLEEELSLMSRGA